jgi:hypothetical protein
MKHSIAAGIFLVLPTVSVQVANATDVFVISDTNQMTSTIDRSLRARGLNPVFINSGDAPPRSGYEILAMMSIAGGDLGDGDVARGGAVVLTASYYCPAANIYLPSFWMSTIKRSFYGAGGPAAGVDAQLSSRIDVLIDDVLSKTLQAETWDKGPVVCRMLKPKATK